MTIRASTLLGAPVVDRQGLRLGKVSDLLVDEPANICYALVDIEHPADTAERTVAVPWSVLELNGDGGQVVLGVSRAALRGLRALRRP
jgi:sporulation protein YlmC with PRC-barrel domain